MFDWFIFLRHAWFKGHSVEVVKYLSTLAFDSSRGWLYKCECGKEWAR